MQIKLQNISMSKLKRKKVKSDLALCDYIICIGKALHLQMI